MQTKVKSGHYSPRLKRLIIICFINSKWSQQHLISTFADKNPSKSIQLTSQNTSLCLSFCFKIANRSDCLKCKKSLNEHIQITFIISLRYCTLTACTVIGWFSSRYPKIGTACLHALLSCSIQFARDNCNNHLANLFFLVIKRYLLTLNLKLSTYPDKLSSTNREKL